MSLKNQVFCEQWFCGYICILNQALHHNKLYIKYETASLISGQMHVKYKLDFLLTLHSEPKAAKKNTFLKSRVSLNLGKCE